MDPETTDPQAPASPDTPAPDPTAPATEQDVVNWQERYSNLQPEYTRATQEAAQLRQELDSLRSDPEAQQKFLQDLGYEIEEPPEFQPPQHIDSETLSYLEQQLNDRLKPFEQQRQEYEQQQQIAALDKHFNDAFAKFGKDRGTDLTEGEQEALVGLALTLPAENGMPPVEKAWERLEALREAHLQQWANTKRTTHPVSPNGTAGTETPNLDDPEQRVAWMAQRVADLDAAN